MADKLRIIVGGDDAGFGYKETLKKDLEASDLVESVVDVGVSEDGHTPYPKVAIEAAERVARGEADRALLICGTGLGVSGSRSPRTRSPGSAPSPRTTATRSSGRSSRTTRRCSAWVSASWASSSPAVSRRSG